MQEICPVSEKQVNERITRFNALFTFLLTLLFVATNQWIIACFLAADFLLRGFFEGAYSPLRALSIIAVKSMHTEPRMINAGPKIFAARMGLVLSGLVFAFGLAGFHVAAISVASILLLFSFLEAAFGFCMACKIYPLIYRS